MSAYLNTSFLIANIVSATLSSLQIVVSVLIADYRKALAVRGDIAAAKRLLLPCYRPFFIALIVIYLSLTLYQGLSILSSHVTNSRFVYNIIKVYVLTLLTIYCAIPILLTQKSISFNSFTNTFLRIFPFWLICVVLLMILLTEPSLSYSSVVSIEVFIMLFSIVPSFYLSIGVLFGFVNCRIQLKSTSNRNIVELLLGFSFVYGVGIIAGTSLVTPSSISTYSSSFSDDIDDNSQHSRNVSNAYSAISLYFVVLASIFNFLYPFTLYRALVADTKFWRGMGKHNQGGLSFVDINDNENDSFASNDSDNDNHMGTRPVATNIDFSIASTSFQKMMSDVSNIVLDFAYVQIDRQIGQGATSDVFCGRYNNKVVAIKVSTPPEITVEVIEVFAMEAKTCSQLRHKNVVTFYGIIVRPPQVGMVFELCEGGNLKGHLSKHARKWTRALRIRACLHASEAVAYLHSRGFIHRDIKAENFMVTRKMVVKLGDFGEASRKRNEESTAAHRMTVLGTVTHMAPELIEASRFYTEAVDIYALGLTFLEIWTGVDPYGELNHFQIYKEVMNGNRPDLPSDAPADFLRLIACMWHQDYKIRPTANDVADELVGLLSDMTGMKFKRDKNGMNAEFTRNSITGGIMPTGNIASSNRFSVVSSSIPPIGDNPSHNPKHRLSMAAIYSTVRTSLFIEEGIGKNMKTDTRDSLSGDEPIVRDSILFGGSETRPKYKIDRRDRRTSSLSVISEVDTSESEGIIDYIPRELEDPSKSRRFFLARGIESVRNWFGLMEDGEDDGSVLGSKTDNFHVKTDSEHYNEESSQDSCAISITTLPSTPGSMTLGTIDPSADSSPNIAINNKDENCYSTDGVEDSHNDKIDITDNKGNFDVNYDKHSMGLEIETYAVVNPFHADASDSSVEYINAKEVENERLTAETNDSASTYDKSSFIISDNTASLSNSSLSNSPTSSNIPNQLTKKSKLVDLSNKSSSTSNILHSSRTSLSNHNHLYKSSHFQHGNPLNSRSSPIVLSSANSSVSLLKETGTRSPLNTISEIEHTMLPSIDENSTAESECNKLESMQQNPQFSSTNVVSLLSTTSDVMDDTMTTLPSNMTCFNPVKISNLGLPPDSPASVGPRASI